MKNKLYDIINELCLDNKNDIIIYIKILKIQMLFTIMLNYFIQKNIKIYLTLIISK